MNFVMSWKVPRKFRLNFDGQWFSIALYQGSITELWMTQIMDREEDTRDYSDRYFTIDHSPKS